ncbi:endoplasmic reticulum membrane-associated RNA degradation protein isoform X2 [Patella vulgata]|uniref:endoplasmic reticulum membrane-associated RNA degradation protein isoform X2 n=1 Tax=Patella vulgata TaxID=6465 RepID=UPI0024A85AB9|nr:endoplasmic reticulum membrane-associated RNA degradation protein isoform X2 [Patella vulgata]
MTTKNYLNSFLSPTVKEILLTDHFFEDKNDETKEILTKGDTLNWCYIEKKLNDLEIDGLSCGSTEWYCKATVYLAPVFIYCEKFLQQTVDNYHKIYLDLIEWTAHTQVLTQCLSLIESDEDGDDLLSMLLLTSVIERSLGDVFLLMGEQCPSMLKDLLITKELHDILGPTIINVLKILIGSPKSLNIRNIAWHGFLSPGELPKRFIYFLLLLVPSIGERLKEKNITPSSIPHRDLVTFSTEQHIPLTGQPFEIEANLEKLLQKSVFIQKQMVPYWKCAFSYYNKQKYGYCVVLLWPLIEHSLRCLFAEVNGCPHRVLTAESTVLYTTFDEMLCKMVSVDQENHLIKKLGQPCMDLLMDLLVYPTGPRLRDRLSHGETNIDTFPRHWADMTVYLSMYCILYFKDSKTSTDVNELCILNDGMTEWISVDPSLQSWNIKAGCDNFINNNLIYHKIKSLILEIDEIIRNKTVNNTDIHIDTWFCEPFTDNAHLLTDLLQVRIPTLFRFNESQQVNKDCKSTTPKLIKESELVSLLSRITMEMSATLSQLKLNVVSRQDKLLKKELRSRQRENMKKLILSLPIFHVTSHLVCILCIYYLYNLHLYTPQYTTQLHRFLKKTLQFCENLRTYTSQDKNKWTEAMELILKHVTIVNQFIAS